MIALQAARVGRHPYFGFGFGFFCIGATGALSARSIFVYSARCLRNAAWSFLVMVVVSFVGGPTGRPRRLCRLLPERLGRFAAHARAHQV